MAVYLILIFISFQLKSIDLSTGEIVNLPPMPMITERFQCEAEILTDSIYVFGGYSASRVEATVERSVLNAQSHLCY